MPNFPGEMPGKCCTVGNTEQLRQFGMAKKKCAEQEINSLPEPPTLEAK